MIGKADEEEVSIFTQQIERKIITAYIGLDFYQTISTKIIFAVAVHSIECWLLPLYCKDRKRAKMLNCLTILNQQLAKINKRLLINPQKKSPRIYDKISRPYIKRRVLKQHYAANLSLKLFVEKLEDVFEQGLRT